MAFTITTVAGVTTITGTDTQDTGTFAQATLDLQAFEAADVVSLTAAQNGTLAKMGDGADILTSVGLTNTQVSLNSGADLYTLTGGANAGEINGGKGRDTINITGSLTNFASVKLGKGSDNLTIGGAGNSGGIQVFGGAGNDTISAGAADATANAIYGGSGDDNVTAAGAWAIYGEDGDDALNGGAAQQNAIYGGEGDDTINGGGGQNNDQLSGGAGANTFVFATPNNSGAAAATDTILDWNQGTGNSIDFTNALTKYANISTASVGGAGVTINANGAITGAATLAAAASAFSTLSNQGGATGGIANGAAIYSDGTNTFLFVQAALASGDYDIVQVNNVSGTDFTISGGNVTAFS